MSYYVLGDPLNLLAVFVPGIYTEYLYDFLIIVRLYLAGLSFLAYCRYHGYEKSGTLAGALIYVFSFYSIVISVLHPYFLNPLIYLPMLLLGIDKILDGEKPVHFILSVFLAAVSNFYFFYMLTIVAAAYAVLVCVRRLFGERSESKSVREPDDRNVHRSPVWKRMMICVGGYCMGLGMAAVIFLPSATVVLGEGRLHVKAEVPFLYEPIYYLKLLIAFVNASADYYSALGYTVIGLLAVLLLFFKTGWKEMRIYKAAFLTGLLGLCIPFVGHVMNGFGYVTNRWVWAFCFIVAVIAARMMPQIQKLGNAVLFAAAAAVVVFALPTFYFRSKGDPQKLRAGVIVCGIVFCILAFLCLLTLLARKKNADRTAAGKSGLIMGILLVNLFLNMFGFYSPCSGNDIENHEKFGTAWEQIHDSPAAVIADLPDAETVRFDTAGLGFEGVKANSAMQYDVNGTAFYYSMTNSATSRFLISNELNIYTDYVYTDLDSRAYIDAVLGVKYVVLPAAEKENVCVPYGYEQEVTASEKYLVYATNNALPLAVFFDSYMGGEQYRNLTAVEKQQAALQTAAIAREELNATGVEVEETDLPVFTDFTSEYEIFCDEGISLEKNRIVVADPAAAIYLDTTSVAGCERYVEWKNLHFEGSGISYISIADDVHTKGIFIAAADSNRYAEIHDVICNMGYRENSAERYEIHFSRAGEYAFDEIVIVNQPMNDLAEQVRQRKETPVVMLMNGNNLTMEVTNEMPGIVYVAVPYSKGWKAEADGEEAPVLSVNGFGMGIAVPEGTHRIEMRYKTPGLVAGAVIALLSWLVFLYFACIKKFGRYAAGCGKT